MAAGLALLFGVIIIALIVALAIGVPALLEYRAGSDDRETIRELKSEVLVERQRTKIATKGLRAIANGAGNPLAEAQDALDLLDNTYTKELS